MFDHTFYFKDTQHFVLPVMQLQRPRITIAEKENELAQIFVEISDQCIGNRFVHLQVYGYSDQLHQLTQQWFKWVPNQIISSIGDVVFERVIMILGFLPSDISGKLEVRFLPPEKDGQIQIKAQGVECKEAYEAIHRIVRLILANRKAFGGIPLLPVISIAVPGTSNHIGGSMPMELHPKKGSTDVLGRPHGMNRTHIVDSTVLPSIPATTIAYTAMANAVRIADQAVGLDM
jgi:hypothetical protein